MTTPVLAHPDDLALSELLDGRLPAGDADAATAHLAACQECGASWQALQSLREVARQSRQLSLESPDLWTAIAARTVHRERIRREVLWSLRWPLAVALFVAFVGGVVVTEAVRSWSARAAMAGAMVAPYPGRFPTPMRVAPKPPGRAE